MVGGEALLKRAATTIGTALASFPIESTVVDLSKCELEFVPFDELRKFTLLRNLNLNRNLLKNLPENVGSLFQV